jgi:LytS/YehU family sensor histidine kinase
LFRYLVDKVQSNYQSRLKLAGIDANLDNALFRIRAGYVGQQFIAQTLAKVAQDATKNNAQAIGMVEDLGLLMRFALETSQKPSIKFSDEMYALDIFCRLYNQLMFEKQNQLKLRCHTQAENQILPMAIYGLMAYVLSKFASEVKSIANWHINIDINCDSNFLFCSVLCRPSAIESEDEKQRLCMLLNDQVIDTMRFRLEQEYSHGSYIECEESQDITFRISIPCVASTQK